MAGLSKSRAALRPRARDVLADLTPKTAAQELDDAVDTTQAVAEDAFDEFDDADNSEVDITANADDSTDYDDVSGEQDTNEQDTSAVTTDEFEDDRAWLDGLTDFTPPADEVGDTAFQPPQQAYQPPQQAYQPPQPYQQPEETYQPQQPETNAPDDGYTQWQFEQRFQNLETVDADVAKELYEKVFKPEIEAAKRQLASEYQATQQRVTQLTKSQELALRERTNNAIIAAFPEAMQVLRSAQFIEYTNASADPYTTQTPFDRIRLAYERGDAQYVINALNQFKQSRTKPKPQVNVESSKGGSTKPSVGKPGKKAMTDSEFQAARRKIMSAPRGTYPPNALRQLTERYNASRKK